jgi:hypothetical protein
VDDGKCKVVKSLTNESPTKFGFIISVYTYTGSDVAKSQLSFNGLGTLEEWQLADFIIVSAKSSSPLYTRLGK